VLEKQLNLFNRYLLLVTFETDDNYSIRFEIANNSSIWFDSKWKNNIRTALFLFDVFVIVAHSVTLIYSLSRAAMQEEELVFIVNKMVLYAVLL